uniref:C2H2-type domain-containing protein n=1 Tax=Caenorhabditis tropicalis TaxID=1561998 RepID=A0A1I7SXE6_9PELO
MEEDEVKREIKREKTTEDEEHDLVMKTILSTTSTSAEVPIVLKEEIKEEAPDANFDMILKNALGLSPDILSPENLMKGMVESHVELPEENEDKDQTQLLNNFFKILFANGGNPSSILDGSTDGTDSTGSSQPSPPADPTNFDSFAMIESLLSDSINQSESSPSEASAAAAAAAAARKRKSTPMKVPKSDDGAGYKCPMEGCNKIFKEKGSVHRHFVTHIGMRFNCDKCKASYTQKHALMLHQKIHANPDAYQCRGCGTNYTTQNGLRLHRQ